jgi:hypothetical protein
MLVALTKSSPLKKVTACFPAFLENIFETKIVIGREIEADLDFFIPVG